MIGASDTCRLRLVRTLCFAALLAAALAGCRTPFGIPLSAQALPGDAIFRFVVMGDAEPKPEPIFFHTAAAVESINAIAAEAGIEFVASIGDIADDGTVEQYEAATAVLSQLTVPHYAIMGNEEFGGGEQRFLEYAARWNDDPDTIPAASYVVERHGIALVFATPDRNGRDFTDGGVAWVEAQLQSYASVPVFLFTHGAPQGVFPDGGDKSISNPAFARVLEYENLRATFSGDLHMDLDRTTHFVTDGDLAHIHVPALERTKIPDTLRHTGRYRIVSVLEDGTVMVNTVDVLRRRIEPMHTHAFKLSMLSVMPAD